MLYLNEKHINEIGVDWPTIINIIKDTCHAMAQSDYAQPLKPYLRYRNLKNRIIAMPGFVGGQINLAGIKWIASFPGNISQGLKRAHAVTVLNNSDTGIPVGIINTPLISCIRTAGVSGLVVDAWRKHTHPAGIKIGMTGFGPIGKMHLDMIFKLLGDAIQQCSIYDINPVSQRDIPEAYAQYIRICDSWESAFEDADIFLTCTVSDVPYVDKAPKKGSLHLNVSLRDYKASWIKYADTIIVDDWEEVCREKTDIEMMHQEFGLHKEDVLSIIDVATNDIFRSHDPAKTVMFNPMGMSVFDIAVGGHYYRTAIEQSVGIPLE
jgi:2,3-diaminopropionate biosynthesis protein SbnB